MIASHQHRFIFLKTRKTAGTSVEIALSKVCGPDDVITEISPEDEALRQAAGGRAPQNFESPPLPRKAYNHMGAKATRDLVGENAFRDYFTFAIERNPWDAVVSLYFWKYKDRPGCPTSRPTSRRSGSSSSPTTAGSTASAALDRSCARTSTGCCALRQQPRHRAAGGLGAARPARYAGPAARQGHTPGRRGTTAPLARPAAPSPERGVHRRLARAGRDGLRRHDRGRSATSSRLDRRDVEQPLALRDQPRTAKPGAQRAPRSANPRCACT